MLIQTIAVFSDPPPPPLPIHMIPFGVWRHSAQQVTPGEGQGVAVCKGSIDQTQHYEDSQTPGGHQDNDCAVMSNRSKGHVCTILMEGVATGMSTCVNVYVWVM